MPKTVRADALDALVRRLRRAFRGTGIRVEIDRERREVRVVGRLGPYGAAPFTVTPVARPRFPVRPLRRRA